MEFMLLMLVLAPFAALFSGGDGSEAPADGDGEVEQSQNGNDDLEAETDDDHAFLAGGGNDSLHGAGGDDALAGQAGNDVIAGGLGDDIMLGGAGDDRMYGNEGNDIMVGGAGNDLMQAGAGNDLLYSLGGADTIRGFDGNDLIDGRDVDGLLTKSASAIMPNVIENNLDAIINARFGENMTDAQVDLFQSELLSTGPGAADRLDGGNGNDFIRGDAGDTMVGGAGNDTFSIYNGPGAPVVVDDYDPANEDIQLVVANTLQGRLTMVDVAGGVELRVGTETLAFVRGTTVAAMDVSNITLQRFAA